MTKCGDTTFVSEFIIHSMEHEKKMRKKKKRHDDKTVNRKINSNFSVRLIHDNILIHIKVFV